MILVTGASGSVGSAVLAELIKAGLSAKAMYRSTEDAKKAPKGIATSIADFADKKSLPAAFQGIETLFLVCSPIPQLVELESNAIDAAAEARIHHVVLQSALGAADYPKSFPAWHRKVEDKLKASGLNYTILRPNGFHQNLGAYYAPSIRGEGVFYAAMGDAKVSFIDVRDIAAFAAKILARPAAYNEKIYELNGPEAFSYGEVAAIVSRVTGKNVRFVDIPEEAQREAMLRLGLPEWQVQALLDLQRYYTAEHKGAETQPPLAGLLGRAPITLEQYIRENKDAFAGQAAGA